MRKRVRSGIAISHCGDEKRIGHFSLRKQNRKRGPACFSAKKIGALCALSEKTEITRPSPPLGKGIRRVTSASRERHLRTLGHKPCARKGCDAVCPAAPEGAACAAASEYRNAAFSSHEDKDRAGQIRELLHCSVRFRVEQHRPPPSESFTTASSPILMAAAIVGPTTRFA